MNNPASSAVPPTILIVDDEPVVLAALQQTLEREKFHVVACSSPTKALAILNERDFAVIISDQPEAAVALREAWDDRFGDVPLDIVESPYRALAGPMLAYLDWLDEAWPTDLEAPITFVIVPEFVPRHWWERPLYNQVAKALRAALVGRPHTVVVDMPYRRERRTALGAAATATGPTAPPTTA